MGCAYLAAGDSGGNDGARGYFAADYGQVSYLAGASLLGQR
jgi:hypothetical protein